MTEMYRQGDVLVVRTDELPQGCKQVDWQDRIVLAYGEVTGHAHAVEALQAKMYELDNVRFLVVEKDGVDLKHEEHSPIFLKEGIYRIVHQREYTPSAERLVRD